MNGTTDNIHLARLQFLTGWQTVQHGNITQGGKLVIEYDPQRLPGLRREWHDAIVWHMEAILHFHPGDQQYRESVLQPINANEGRGPVRGYLPKPINIDVPKDAAQLELWFRSWLDVSGYQEVWDSQFGQNYWFDIVQEISILAKSRLRR